MVIETFCVEMKNQIRQGTNFYKQAAIKYQNKSCILQKLIL